LRSIIRFLLRLILLYPVAAGYWLVTFLRNKLYNWKIFKQTRLPVKVISIGNLSTGGTGKTIFCEYLLSFLKSRGLQVAYLSRGYGRRTTGYLEVNPDEHSFREVGDEALQVATKFRSMMVAVCENRVVGVKQLLKLHPNLDVVILDDAFQHRRIARDLDILMIDYNHLPWKNRILPLGRLREPYIGIKRADALVINKITEEYQIKPLEHFFEKKFKLDIPVIYAGIDGDRLYDFRHKMEEGTPIADYRQTPAVIFSGLGNNDQFEHHMREHAIYPMHVYKFKDHYAYRKRDLDRIVRRFKIVRRERHIVNQPIIITTEKDYNRLKKAPWLDEYLQEAPFYYMTVSMKFYKNSTRLKRLLNKHFPKHVEQEEDDTPKYHEYHSI
jgi:tetraacyldisaccharide 4'-kinase